MTSGSSSLTVVLLYEDLAAGRRGKYFCDAAFSAAGLDIEPGYIPCNFSLLALPEVFDTMASSAAEADLLMISLSGHKPLPQSVTDWIETWLRLALPPCPALAAVIRSPLFWGAAVCDYLREAAARKHIDFFPYNLAHGHRTPTFRACRSRETMEPGSATRLAAGVTGENSHPTFHIYQCN